MPKDDIRQIVEESKQMIDQDRKAFADSVRKELDSFKKKALSGI